MSCCLVVDSWARIPWHANFGLPPFSQLLGLCVHYQNGGSGGTLSHREDLGHNSPILLAFRDARLASDLVLLAGSIMIEGAHKKVNLDPHWPTVAVHCASGPEMPEMPVKPEPWRARRLAETRAQVAQGEKQLEGAMPKRWWSNAFLSGLDWFR